MSVRGTTGRLLVTLAVVVLLAGCGAGATSSPSPAATATTNPAEVGVTPAPPALDASRPWCRPGGPGVRLSARVEARRAGAGRPGPGRPVGARHGAWRSTAAQGRLRGPRGTPWQRPRDVDVRRVHEHLDADASEPGAAELRERACSSTTSTPT